MDKKFLCVVIDKPSKKTLKEYDPIYSNDIMTAKAIIAKDYATLFGWNNNWSVDAVEID